METYRGYELLPQEGFGVLILFKGEVVDSADSKAQAYTIIDTWLNAP